MIYPEGTLTDAGPLFAVVAPQGQPELSAQCRQVLLTLEMPLVTTWACLSEAMHLAGRSMQSRIALLITSGTLRLHMTSEAETERILHLMEQYRDRPMNLADASLVVLAESVGYKRVFSIDGDFFIYRLSGGTALEVVPGPTTRR